jgi:hypothetical protein
MMKKIFALEIFCAALAASALIFAASPSEAKRYDNERFDFRVDVNESDFALQPPPANGDGMVFVSRADGRVSVRFYARNQGDPETDTIRSEGARQMPDTAFNEFHTFNRRDFYLQYDNDGLRTELMIFLVRGVFYTGVSVAPIELYDAYNSKFADIYRSWKIHGNPTVY